MQNLHEKQHFVEHLFILEKLKEQSCSCVSLLVKYFAGLLHHSFESENESCHKTTLDMAGHHGNQYNTIQYIRFLYHFAFVCFQEN